MRAYRVSKECNSPTDEKIKLIKEYDVDDLLYVLRDIERNPKRYDECVIKKMLWIGFMTQGLCVSDYKF